MWQFQLQHLFLWLWTRFILQHIFIFLDQLNIIKDNGLAKHELLLLKICNSLKPMFYNEHSYNVREGDPWLIRYSWLWKALYGLVQVIMGQDLTLGMKHLEKGQYLGRKLLQWVLTPTSAMYNLSKLPISSKTLKHTQKWLGLGWISLFPIPNFLNMRNSIPNFFSLIERDVLCHKNLVFL